MPNKPTGHDWPAFTVVRKPLAWLKPYERNARTHSDSQVAQIAKSMREFGWTMPVLAREDGTIIAGHGRVEAAKKLGNIADVPVIVATGWTETQCRAYTLADNQLGSTSQWDALTLETEMGELAELGVDLGTLGFDEPMRRRKADAGSVSPQLSDLSYSIIVRCSHEDQQRKLLEQFEREGLTCEALIS